MTREEIYNRIDSEHGVPFHKNIDFSGHTVYKGESFITFHFVEVKGINTVVIDYLYITKKRELIKLLAFCVNFWVGNKVKFVYLREHKREANYIKKYFPIIGFHIDEREQDGLWKYEWECTNGFSQDSIIEAFL